MSWRRGRSVGRRLGFAALVLVVAGSFTTVGAQTVSARSAATGWSPPFSGPKAYEDLAPTQVTDPSQLNQPIGQQRADEIAQKLGLRKSRTLTEKQYIALISGQGNNGKADAAKIIDESVRILTNTVGRPLACDAASGGPSPSVLASYGLMVDEKCNLESPANMAAPTRRINPLLTPSFLCGRAQDPNCGYIGEWMRSNNAVAPLLQLYSSAYPALVAYGFACQTLATNAQLVTNTKNGVRAEVGMSMAPPLWLVNFSLIYTLKPSLAALMPAWWAPIPQPVADALLEAGAHNGSGQVPYSEYASYFD